MNERDKLYKTLRICLYIFFGMIALSLILNILASII